MVVIIQTAILYNYAGNHNNNIIISEKVRSTLSDAGMMIYSHEINFCGINSHVINSYKSNFSYKFFIKSTIRKTTFIKPTAFKSTYKNKANN